MKDTEFLSNVSGLLGVEQDATTFQTVHDETQILHSNYQAVMNRYSKICNALSGKVVPVDQLLTRITELKRGEEAKLELTRITNVLVESDVMKRNALTSVEALIADHDRVASLEEAYSSKVEDWQELCDFLNLLSTASREDVLDTIHLMEFNRDAAAKIADVAVSERDEAALNALAISTELNELLTDELLDRLGLENGYTPEQFHASVKSLFNERDELHEERENLLTSCIFKTFSKCPRGRARADVQNLTLDDIPNMVAHSFVLREDLVQARKERDEALQFRDQYFSVLNDVATNLGDPGIPFASLPSEVVKLNSVVEDLVEERDGLSLDVEYLQTPQLSETRYVLHGDIQPCSVLYSDETTTLLRLDEGDIMCETDTIEWSDELTYRCQELLKSTWTGTGTQQKRYSEALAKLVREGKLHLDDSVTGVETCDA